MPDIITESIHFPIECKRQLNELLGEAAGSYLETLDNFTNQFIQEIDKLFVIRQSKIADALNSELKNPSSEEKRQERVSTQLKAFNPKLLAEDMQLKISELLSVNTYHANARAFLNDPYTSPFFNRYVLAEDMYLQLLRGGIRKLNSIYSEMNVLVLANDNMIKTIDDLNRSSGLRKGLSLAASIVGGVLGAATGISHGGRVGSRLVRSMVGGLLDGRDKIDVAITEYSNAFDCTHMAWIRSKDDLSKELMGVVYSIYGGALLRMINDLNSLGLTVSALNVNGKILGNQVDIKVSLSEPVKKEFDGWASETLRSISNLIENGQFGQAYAIAIQSLMFCLKHKPRLQEWNDEHQNFSLMIQKQLVYSAALVAEQIGKNDHSKLLTFWLQVIKNIAFLPDDTNNSNLICPLVDACEILEAQDTSSQEIACGVINLLREKYLDRISGLHQNNKTYYSVDGEAYCKQSIFLLEIAHATYVKSEKSIQSFELIKKYQEIANRRGLDWLFSCFLAARRVGATLANPLTKKLIQRIVVRSFFIAGLSFLTFTTALIILILAK